MKVSILKSKTFSINEASFLEPLRINSDVLKSLRINLHWINDHSCMSQSSDVMLLSSHYFRPLWRILGVTQVLEIINNIKGKVKKLYWLDLSDSTGTCNFNVLPFVDLYYKMSLLKDKSLYLNSWHTGRIHCDYYLKLFNINCEESIEDHLSVRANNDSLSKIKLSWNYGIRYFGLCANKTLNLSNYYNIRLEHRNFWIKPNLDRKKLVSCRFNTKYKRDSVSLPRQKIYEKFKQNNFVSSVNYYRYLKELENSFYVISPFGFGEICYRDFEAVRRGSLCVKQDMSHLDTWPNLWLRDTYLPIKWNLENLDDIRRELTASRSLHLSYAKRAQEIYMKSFNKEIMLKKIITLINGA